MELHRNQFESILKNSNLTLYNIYTKIFSIYSFAIDFFHLPLENDQTTILEFFYTHLHKKDISSNFINDDHSLFNTHKIKSCCFKFALNYYRARTVYNLNHHEYFDKIPLLSTQDSIFNFLISIIKEKSSKLEVIFRASHISNSLAFLDILKNNVTNIYSNNFCNIFHIIFDDVNLVNNFSYEFLENDDVKLHFTRKGEIFYIDHKMLVTPNQCIILKGTSLGKLKILTSDYEGITFIIKKEFFNFFSLDTNSVIFLKKNWLLDDNLINQIKNLKANENSNIIILNMIFELFLKICDENERLKIKDLSCSSIFSIVDYIENNLDNNLSVQKLQKNFFIGKNSLYSIFKDYFSTSVLQYITNKKLERSAQLLLTSNLTSSEISNMLNFSNASRFLSYFKKKYKLSPRDFKKKFKT